MSQTKVSSPNGAYYGPPIPPQPQPLHHRHPNYDFLATVIKLILVIVIVIGITTFIFWLVVRPTDVKFYITTTELTQFELINGSTLIYNLSLKMTVRNPNKKIRVYYDSLYATASYQEERFSWEFLEPFYQGHKNTTMLPVVFRGQSLLVLSSDEITSFKEDKKAGFFYTEVKLYTWIRFKIGSVKTKHYRPDIECDLRVPLASNGTIAGVFESTRCDVDF